MHIITSACIVAFVFAAPASGDAKWSEHELVQVRTTLQHIRHLIDTTTRHTILFFFFSFLSRSLFYLFLLMFALYNLLVVTGCRRNSRKHGFLERCMREA